MKLSAVVLAAGIGKRMKSSLPKVLHSIQGTTMLQHVVNTLQELKPLRIVVVAGQHLAEIKASLQDIDRISFAEQREPRGTGDALLRAVSFLGKGKGNDQSL